MKSKNLVSLSVALAFLVLASTGLLIYFGQGTHPVEHTHAWFGILFVIAAVFHIVNNWASLKGYSQDRKTGGIRKEFIIPTALAAVFAIGIAADVPVFDKLANAGKMLVRGNKPKPGGPLSQQAVDSIAHSTEATYLKAYSTSDTASLWSVVDKKALIRNESGAVGTGSETLPDLMKLASTSASQHTVDRAESIDNNFIMVYGTLTNPSNPAKLLYSHLLKQKDNAWKIVAIQTAQPTSLPGTPVASK
ncbi:DUF4405 domain-containing protein [Spirosoma sp. SC4-14]|uniref:DUF4405 domain-containing protein n=1 Tax=Spirosoma sp. SC4-14 TaxID=3128900 RepID=UPI0030CF07E0